MFIISKISIFISLILFSINSHAIDIKVFYVKGDVTSTDLDGVTKPLKKNDLLLEGDTITSKEDSFAILKIAGHSTHKIESNTILLIADLPYKFEGSDELEQGANLLLKAGTIFSDIEKSKGVKAITIRTKSSAMGVRGTKLVVSIDKATSDLIVGVKTGEVEIENFVSGQRDVLIKKQGILIDGDTNFSAPKRYSWLNDLSWEMTRKSDKNQFRQKRKNILKEIRKKKAKWSRNQVVFKQKELNWSQKEKSYLKRVENLKPSSIKQQRQVRLNTIIRKMPKDIAGGVQNKQNNFRNDFLNIRKSNNSINDQNLQKMKQKRRQYRPKPPTAPTSPVDPTAPSIPVGGGSLNGGTPGGI